MSKASIKLLSAIAIILFIAVIPIVVFATNEDISIVKTTNSEYTIYIKGISTQNFKYAFTNIENADPNGMDLSFINSISDSRGNQVAFLNAETYEKLSKNNETIYMWAKTKDEKENEKLILENIQLDLSKALDEESLDQVETLTNRIKVEVADSKEDTKLEKNENINGVDVVKSLGYIKILDDEKATYYYEMVKLPSTEEYNNLKKLADQLNAEYNEKDMYEKVQIATEFNKAFETVTSQAKWEEVNDMIIKQDENSVAGDEYVVLLKKVAENDGVEEQTFDVQFLTADDYYEQEIETKNIKTQETTKLPITYDSIALFVVLGIIVVLVIVVFIRMRKLNKQNNEEK